MTIWLAETRRSLLCIKAVSLVCFLLICLLYCVYIYMYSINARVADHVKETTEFYTRLRGGGRKKICHFKGLGVEDGIILKCVVRKYGRVRFDCYGSGYK